MGGTVSSVRPFDDDRRAAGDRLRSLEKLREGLLRGSQDDGIGVWRCFVRQRGDVQAAEHDVRASRAVTIRDAVRAVCVGDVDLNQDQVGVIVCGQALDVFVDEDRLVAGAQICGERREAERRKERVLDWPPIRTGSLGQGGQDEFDSQVSSRAHTLYCKVIARGEPIREYDAISGGNGGHSDPAPRRSPRPGSARRPSRRRSRPRLRHRCGRRPSRSAENRR